MHYMSTALPKSLSDWRKKKEGKKASTFSPSWEECTSLLWTVVITKVKTASSVLLIPSLSLLEYHQWWGSHYLTQQCLYFQTAFVTVQSLLVLYLSAIAQVQSAQHASLQPPEFSLLLAKNPQVFLILHTGHGLQTSQPTGNGWHFTSLPLKLNCSELIPTLPPPVRSMHFSWLGLYWVKLMWFLAMETNSNWLKKNKAKQKSNSVAHKGVPA